MFKKRLVKWWRELLLLLSDNRGEEDDGDGEGTEGNSGEEEGTEEVDEDADVNSGKKDGKDRSQYIPRERFDQVNTKAQKVDSLIATGVLVEDSQGNLVISSQAIKGVQKDLTPDEKKELKSLRFTKDEVDEGSWPLVDKINKSFDHYDTQFAKSNFRHAATQSELAILRDYPEFIQRDSPLRKKALDIMKNDSEFKTTYRGNPQAGYWAAKRAAELLKTPTAKPKKKGKFIVGKGDGGEGSKKKTVDLTNLSKAELDKLEKEEFNRLNKLGK